MRNHRRVHTGPILHTGTHYIAMGVRNVQRQDMNGWEYFSIDTSW